LRAAFYDRTGRAREVLHLGELPFPRLGPSDALVRMHASGINPSDWKRRIGWRSSEPLRRRVIPHTDGAGVVEALGANVDKSWLGRRVWIWNANAAVRPDDPVETGTAAEYAALPVSQLVPLPDHVGFDVGACLGIPACTAHYAVFADGEVSRKTILVRGGAGAVGQLAVQFASGAGATVVATVSSDEKAAIASQAGAQHVINYRTDNALDSLRSAAPRGFDRIIEVDFAANAAENAAVIAQGGAIVSYSSTSNPEPTLPYYPLQLKGATIRLVTSYNIPAPSRQQAIREISARLADRRLLVPIADRFPLSDIGAAHELAESGRSIGRLVVMI
jgi:NADPH2:quinone reductase